MIMGLLVLASIKDHLRIYVPKIMICTKNVQKQLVTSC